VLTSFLPSLLLLASSDLGGKIDTALFKYDAIICLRQVGCVKIKAGND